MRRLISRAAVPVTESKLSGFLATDTAPWGAKRSAALSPVQAAVLDAELRATTGEWGDAKPKSLVGLFAMCHHRVYGVRCEELEVPREFSAAVRGCTALLAGHGDDRDGIAKFIVWTWDKERRTREWRKNQGMAPSTWRVTARYQFSKKLFTDYLVATGTRHG